MEFKSSRECERDDLMVTLTAATTVDDNGEPEMEPAPTIVPKMFHAYFCVTCWGEFDTFEEAKQHLKVEVAA